ncbi:beta-xylosidase/alpha-L-arabinofuranosidase 1-like isoform X2 [Nicotiana sylvestris]|uniref:Probable beta-D-xylosidase 5 isoform X2 n=1 Tax=Nicotiana sylvestris TaxID=4096 RepID=A0A1U7YUP6_NICSY|nr:PREDICTED: probable beta-D-xylosidase 5 isoform X2 [Nicotiana sylvestris]
MANFTFLHFFTILIFSFLISRISARNIPYNSSITALNDLTYNQTRRVCDTSRFAKLGLDMNDFAYCDKSLPYAVRVKDLIDRMTLSEKARQIGDTAFGVARIGLPKYEWWSEALHGVSNVGQYYSLASFFDKVVPGATSFPTVITTTASFNESLWKAIGQAVSTEARAMFNLGHAGLTFWSPNINVVRDPRWGRVLETPGEDPFVVGKYASNYVRGLQDVEGTENAKDLNSRPLKVAACCKHYAAYDVDNWLGVDRYHFDSRVTEQDMMETFLKPFEMCVKEGDVTSVMCSYNRINGIPACADPKLLKGKIRGDWDLHGYIVSDCDSIEVMLHGHKWLGDEPEDAVAQGLKAGIPCKITTPIHGFSLYSKVDYKAGCGEILCKNESLIFPAMKAAKKADATVLIVGLDLSVEAESLDRVDLLLPGYQTQLINQVAQVSKGPVILVIMSAGGIDISFAKNNPKIKSIIWAGYPGEEGGRAIADVVFGSYNPGGKLPLTWHENSYVDMLPMTSMPLRPIDNLGYPGRTYKFFNGSTVYPFGYGLSYTNFTYNLLSARQKIQVKLNKFQHCRDLNYTAGTHVPPCRAVSIDDLECGDDLNFDFSIEVENIGKKDGSDVLMIYWIPPEDIAEAPLKQLIGFKKVFVKIGEKKKVDFVLNACKNLGIVNYRAYNLLAAGGHNFVIGNGKLSFPVQVSFHR